MPLIVDPNSGYLYGFPKPVPEEFVLDKQINPSKREEFNQWLSEQCKGNQIAYTRMWYKEDED